MAVAIRRITNQWWNGIAQTSSRNYMWWQWQRKWMEISMTTTMMRREDEEKEEEDVSPWLSKWDNLLSLSWPEKEPRLEDAASKRLGLERLSKATTWDKASLSMIRWLSSAPSETTTLTSLKLQKWCHKDPPSQKFGTFLIKFRLKIHRFVVGSKISDSRPSGSKWHQHHVCAALLAIDLHRLQPVTRPTGE